MVSPFRRHQQKVHGLISAGPARASIGPAPVELKPDSPLGQEYASLRVLLHDNLRALADIQSHEARIPKKIEFAGAFADWIEGVLAAGESGSGAQDEILLTNMVWAVDYRDFDYALRLGAHAIRYHLVMQAPFTRSVACFLAEDIAKLSLTHQDLVTHEQLLKLAQMVEGSDMPDQVIARLHKAIGLSFVRKAETFDPAADNAPAGGKSAYLTEALSQFTRALALDREAGVKTQIRTLTAQLKKLANADAADS